MFFYILLIAFFLYRFIKTRSVALIWLIALACISAANYMGLVDRLDPPLPYIVYALAAITAIGSVVSSTIELKQTKRDYLKSRRAKRETTDEPHGEFGGTHDRIVVQGTDGEEKILYVKRNQDHEEDQSEEKAVEDKIVPYGTTEAEDDQNENVPHGTIDKEFALGEDVSCETDDAKDEEESGSREDKSSATRERIIIQGVDGKEKVLYIERNKSRETEKHDEDIDRDENVPYGTMNEENEDKIEDKSDKQGANGEEPLE